MSFNYSNLNKLQGMLSKSAFVPIDPKSAQAAPPPDAGGMPPPGDPAAGGMPPPDAGGMPPMDPSMMGGGMPPGMPPMDPAAMGGGMPPPPPGPPMDPMMGMPPTQGDISPDGEPYIKVTWKQLIKMLEQLNALKNSTGSQDQQAAPVAPSGPDPASLAAIDAKLDAVINGIGG